MCYCYRNIILYSIVNWDQDFTSLWRNFFYFIRPGEGGFKSLWLWLVKLLISDFCKNQWILISASITHNPNWYILLGQRLATVFPKSNTIYPQI